MDRTDVERQVVENWKSDAGDLCITKPIPGVIVFTYHGHITAEAVPVIEHSVDQVLEAGLTPDLFIDLEHVTSYDSDYRKAVSAWGARNYRRFGEVRVLVRSKFVAMGIAVSNLTSSGKLRPTTKREEFLSALQGAIQRHASEC